MSATAVETKVIQSIHPPLIGEPPNSRPGAMFDNLHQEGGFLASLDSRTHIVYPLGQYVPDDGKSFHAMMTQQDPHRFRNIPEMSHADLSPISGFALDFLKTQKDESTKHVVSWNIGADATRRTSQSWWNNHFHMVGIADSAIAKTEPGIPLEMQEVVGAHNLSFITQYWFQRTLPAMGSLVAPGDPNRQTFAGFPEAVGGVSFKFTQPPTAEQTTRLMKQLDHQYSQLHQAIFQLFVTNYDEAVASQGRISYECRPLKEIIHNINNWKDDEQDPRMTQFKSAMRAFAWAFHHYPNQSDPQKRIITPPAYTGTMFKDGKDYYVGLAGHIYTYTGGMETLGMQLQRQASDGIIANDKRKARAAQAIENVFRYRRELKQAA